MGTPYLLQDPGFLVLWDLLFQGSHLLVFDGCETVVVIAVHIQVGEAAGLKEIAQFSRSEIMMR